MEKVTPPLKWAGGKRWLIPHLEPIWQQYEHHKLIEPFCGGLAVSLGLLPRYALLNDINYHLINFLRWLQKGLYIEMPMKNEKEFYYQCRKRFNELILQGEADSKEAASLFYYLNRTAYNGLCRFNKKGEFNVPFGSYKTINYKRDFSQYKDVFANWEFACMDFENISVKGDEFIYADPPYDVDFRQYSQGGFTWDDQVRLAQWLANHTGPVVASNQATNRIIELYSDLGFKLLFLDGPRFISCDGNRDKAKEILAIKEKGSTTHS